MKAATINPVLRFALVICLFAAVSLSSCAVSLSPQNTQPMPTPSPSAVSPAPPETATPATATAMELPPSPAPDKDFPMTPEDFLKRYNESFMAYRWIPSQVLDYISDGSMIPGSLKAGKTRINIVSIKSGAAKIHEFEWTGDPVVYQTEEPQPTIKTYDVDENAAVWLLTSMNGFYRIPVADLYSYIETDYGKLTVWGYTLKDGKIVELVEQYVS